MANGERPANRTQEGVCHFGWSGRCAREEAVVQNEGRCSVNARSAQGTARAASAHVILTFFGHSAPVSTPRVRAGDPVLLHFYTSVVPGVNVTARNVVLRTELARQCVGSRVHHANNEVGKCIA